MRLRRGLADGNEVVSRCNEPNGLRISGKRNPWYSQLGTRDQKTKNPAEGDKAVFPATKPCVNHQ